MRRTTLLCVGLIVALGGPAGAGAAPSSTLAPLAGTWQFDGAKVQVTGSGGLYQGVVTSGSYGGCAQVVHPGFVAWRNLHASASGKNYFGTSPWYWLDDCSFAGEGSLEIRLTSKNAGSWSSTSPDGTTASSTISRIGSGPPAPKINCTKRGRPVICTGAQKQVAKTQIKRGKQADSLGDRIRKARQALIDGTDTAADIYIDIMSYVVGGRKLELPAVQLPKFTIDWRTVDLDTLLSRADFRGKDALLELYAFAKESDKALQYTNELMQAADDFYASSPENASEMDVVSQGMNGGRNYNDPSLTNEERFVVACNMTDLTGAKKKLINHMVELGKAGAKVTHTLP